MAERDIGGGLDVGSVAGLQDGGLVRVAQQEQFSLGAMRMIAAAAGCSIKTHETDYDGVDLTIAASAEYETFYGPQVEVQLKCTTQRDLLRDDHLVWCLARKPFRKLTHPKRYIPALLAVVLIPKEPTDWLPLSEEGMVSPCRVYWEHAANLGTIEDDMASRTVRLPRSNLLTVDALKGIMKAIGEGGQW
ncbi:DUF4365 domain-containing protein [Crossiella sp. NPDC003009]